MTLLYRERVSWRLILRLAIITYCVTTPITQQIQTTTGQLLLDNYTFPHHSQCLVHSPIKGILRCLTKLTTFISFWQAPLTNQAIRYSGRNDRSTSSHVGGNNLLDEKVGVGGRWIQGCWTLSSGRRHFFPSFLPVATCIIPSSFWAGLSRALGNAGVCP